jgi:4-methyl-5(b-hydroxyethyl)-thiazole monophosphate biosynthesis
MEAMRTVLAILPEGFEELESVAPIDLLRRAGVHVTVASLGEDPRVTGRNALVLHADTSLAAVLADPHATPFDCIFLPGGPGVKHLRADPRVPALVAAQAAAGRYVAAICAAPTVLFDAGVLAHRRFTAHFSVASELPGLVADERVVADGPILTSRGAGTAIDLGLLLVATLCTPAVRDEIARSICA